MNEDVSCLAIDPAHGRPMSYLSRLCSCCLTLQFDAGRLSSVLQSLCIEGKRYI